jgi:GAF domain-containing protein
MPSTPSSDVSGEPPGTGPRPTVSTLLELVLDTPSVEAYLDEVATMAAALEPAIAGVGVTVRRGGDVLTVAASNDVALGVDEVQYGLGAGPCLETLDTGVAVIVHDLADDDDRWNGYPRHAVAGGVRSSVSLPLTVSGETIGVLNCYGSEAGMFVDGLTARLVDFATHAELALAVALRSAQQTDLVEQLPTAMQSRSVIDQAMGILMARQRCTAQEAFAILRTASQSRNRKIVDIAGDLVARTTGAEPQAGRFDT